MCAWLRCIMVVTGLVGCASQSPFTARSGDTVPASPSVNQILLEKKVATFSAKRIAPKEVTPLVQDGVRYEVVVNGRPLGYEHRGGIIAAFDDKTGAQLWHMQVYRNQYNERLEKDVQDVYITTIEGAEDGKALLISNERRKLFLLRLGDRSVTALD